MARTLKQFDFGERAQGRYPWSEWANGKIWEIKQGEDFDVRVEGMRNQMHMQARNRHLKVRTKVNCDSIVFQFYPNPNCRKATVAAKP